MLLPLPRGYGAVMCGQVESFDLVMSHAANKKKSGDLR